VKIKIFHYNNCSSLVPLRSIAFCPIEKMVDDKIGSMMKVKGIEQLEVPTYNNHNLINFLGV
jgi:hypothetical protein